MALSSQEISGWAAGIIRRGWNYGLFRHHWVAAVDAKAFSAEIFPNPASYYVNLFIQLIVSNNFTATITDEAGKTVFTQKNIQPTILYSLPVSNIPAGTYILSINNQSISYSQKIVIAK